MNNFEFSHDGKTYIRVNKRKARRLYSEGKEIYVQANNLLLFSCWTHPAIYKKTPGESKNFNFFDCHISAFEYYNCINSETGKTAAFYIVSGEGEK